MIQEILKMQSDVKNRVYLAPLTEDALPVMFEWINNRELVLLNAPFKPITWEEHRQWFYSLENRSDLIIFGIHRESTQELIGTCQLHSIHPIHRSAEFQIRIGRATLHNKGYGSTAVRLLLDYGFRRLMLHRIYLHVFKTNSRAIHVYEKVGFQYEGILREAAFIEDRFVDVHIMGILYSDWENASI